MRSRTGGFFRSTALKGFIQMNIKISSIVEKAIPVMLGMGAFFLIVKWGKENDIPILSDIADILDQ